MTLSKLAKLANVSVSTASKAFSMSDEVNEQTREMVFEVAKEHRCFKKFFNAKYPKLVVAVICPELQSRYYSRLLTYIQSELNKHNCEVCAAVSDFSKDKADQLIIYYEKYTSVDAIILIGGTVSETVIHETPIICLCSADDCKADIRINVDINGSIGQAIDMFINCGINKIGFIGEGFTDSKRNAFTQIMKSKFGCVDENLISITDERFEQGGYLAMQKFYSSGTIPKAIICAYDYMAFGAIRCIHDNGQKIPDDILVVGMDNLDESEYFTPRLSSIDMLNEKVAKKAVDSLFDILLNNGFENNTTYSSKLVLRESTDSNGRTPDLI